MSDTGKLILIAGFSGAGKTTLARAALEAFAHTRYITTYTTRPRREDEAADGSFEYEFVGREEYERLRGGGEWGHGEYAGEFYGIDAGQAKRDLAAGTNLVMCMVPNIPTIERLEGLCGLRAIVIWLDTPVAVANARIAAEDDRLRRQRSKNELQNTASAKLIKERADYVFEPSRATEDSVARFVALLKTIL